MKRFVSLLSIAVILLSAVVIHNSLTPQQEKFVSVVDKVMDSCVSIRVFGKQGGRVLQVGGAGVYVSSNAYILTCAHLFTDFDVTERILIMRSNDDIVVATLVSIDKDMDLALLKTSFYNRTPYSRLADPRYLKVGQEVFAVGAPLGLDFTVTTGIISALFRDLDDRYNVTQSDTAINPGNSGGPLFNLKGEIVGINSFMVSSSFIPVFSGLGFSVQSGQCLEFLTRAKRIAKDLTL